MSDPSTPLAPKSVFDQIEDELGATFHGRAFLAEVNRRARTRETAILLDAMARLDRNARTRDELPAHDELRMLVKQIETALRDAKLAFGRSITRSPELRSSSTPASMVTFEQETTATIRNSAEIVQETAWRMRECRLDAGLCDRLDEQTDAIYAACRRQERTLEGLGTVERAIGRADMFLTELLSALTPDPAPGAVPLSATLPASFIDGDIAFAAPSLTGDADIGED